MPFILRPRHDLHATVLAAGAFALAAGLGAQARAAGEVDLIAELEAAADEAGIDLDLPTWDVSGEIEAGYGYNNNVLLAAFDPDGSALVRATANALAWRMPKNGFEAIGYLDASYTRYFSAATDDATLVIGRAEGRWRPGKAWRLALAAQGIFQDEVIDASSLESDFTSVHAQLGSAALIPSAEWTFARDWSWTLRPAVRRFDYRAPLDDFTEAEIETTFARDLGRAGRPVIALRSLWRDYDSRPQAGPAGRPLYGTELKVQQHNVEFRHDLEREGTAPWNARLRAGFLQNRDNGSGYFDYDRRNVDLSGSYEHGAWSLEMEAGWRTYDYLIQLAGFGIDPQHRARDEWRAFLRTEYALRETLVLFAELEYVDSRSNDPFAAYDNSVVVAGVKWSP